MSDGNSWCTCRRRYGQKGGYDTSGCPVHDRNRVIKYEEPSQEWVVVVQGREYELEGSPRVSVRLIRAAALKAHGIINYKMTDDIDRTWEVRDGDGELLPPSALVDRTTKLYINPRPGWGG